MRRRLGKASAVYGLTYQQHLEHPVLTRGVIARDRSGRG